LTRIAQTAKAKEQHTTVEINERFLVVESTLDFFAGIQRNRSSRKMSKHNIKRGPIDRTPKQLQRDRWYTNQRAKQLKTKKVISPVTFLNLSDGCKISVMPIRNSTTTAIELIKQLSSKHNEGQP
jgi:hypothetical protein